MPAGPRTTEGPSEILPEPAEVSAALFKAVGNGSVPRATISLVHLRAGRLVGSTCPTVLHTGFLREGRGLGGADHIRGVLVPASVPVVTRERKRGRGRTGARDMS